MAQMLMHIYLRPEMQVPKRELIELFDKNAFMRKRFIEGSVVDLFDAESDVIRLKPKGEKSAFFYALL